MIGRQLRHTFRDLAVVTVRERWVDAGCEQGVLHVRVDVGEDHVAYQPDRHGPVCRTFRSQPSTLPHCLRQGGNVHHGISRPPSSTSR